MFRDDGALAGHKKGVTVVISTGKRSCAFELLRVPCAPLLELPPFIERRAEQSRERRRIAELTEIR